MLSYLFTLSQTTIVVLVAVVAVGLYGLYRRLLPQVLPGIPYNKKAASNIFGDLPSQYTYREGPMQWMVAQTEKKNYPMHQILQPLGQKPMIVLADYREAQDITIRRSEFDRADGIADFYAGVLPTFHANLKTGPVWKTKRRLLQDLMSPSFLHDVAAPNIHASIHTLVDLWKEKIRICDGRPFRSGEDVKLSAFDAILAFTFGQRFPDRALTTQLEHTQRLPGEPGDRDSAVRFEYITNEEKAIESLLHVTDLIAQGTSSPLGVLAWPFTLMKPSTKKIAMTRALFLKDQASKAGERLEAGDWSSDDNDGIKSAIDLMVKREKQLAEKEGRDAKYWSQSMHDEMLGFLLAGHDTTAATGQWALKFLTNNQDVQAKLRDALRVAHSDAVSEGRLPTATEITKANIPFLEAFIEETLRMASSVFGVDRQTSKDTTVLGQHIPKGTMFFIVNQGPSFTKPGFPIDESVRSETSQKNGRERGIQEWDPSDIGVFKPERWLVAKDDDTTSFNSTAGPDMPFGAGIRGCFGRRLAYLGLRLTITLMVWSFEMQNVPESMAGYEAVDGLTHCPKHDYVRLKAL